MCSERNLLKLADECVKFSVRVFHDAIHPFLGVAALNGTLAVGSAGILNSGSVSLSRVAGDHVCGVVVSRWFLWGFGGMVVRESVKSGRKSRCFETRAGSCVDK